MDDELEEYLIQPNTLYCTFEYEGPYRLIYSKIGYQWPERGPYPEHSDFTEAIATISSTNNLIVSILKPLKSVAAKLSDSESMPYDLPHDEGSEAYQAFRVPQDFFERWRGFNVIEPLKVPTPVSPLVPQLYGYYVPDIDPTELDSESTESESPLLRYHRRYFSPILLLEDCGQKLDPEKLTLDDQ